MHSLDIEKKIWFFWNQGLDSMPDLVRHCYDSWRILNPDWDTVFLDNQNLSEFLKIDFEIKNLSIQSYSDIIRINLLKKYGGVWVDATCYCSIPLKNWLFDQMKSGFFAFDKPAKDRMISSWFLAAGRNNELVKIYCDSTNNFWSKNPDLLRWNKNINNFPESFYQSGGVDRLLETPSEWFSIYTTKTAKLYHYFWFHYLFAELYLTNSTFKKIWDQTPKISAEYPHKVQFSGQFEELTDEIRDYIKSNVSPVHKLSWKTKGELNPNTTLYYLLKKSNIEM